MKASPVAGPPQLRPLTGGTAKTTKVRASLFFVSLTRHERLERPKATALSSKLIWRAAKCVKLHLFVSDTQGLWGRGGPKHLV